MCYRCKRKGHFGTQCFSKFVAELSSDNYLDVAFLDTLSSTHESAWLAKVKLCDQDTVFKLDTGAEVTAIPEQSFKRLGEQKLASPEKTLYGPSHQLLQVAGQFQGKFSYMNETAVQTVYVVNGLRTNLLGLPAITALNIVARVDATSTTTSKGNNTPELHPNVEQELSDSQSGRTRCLCTS